MQARKYFQTDTIILYSDIIFESKIIEKIIKTKEDISIAIDMNWEEKYEGRTEHPKSEAENVEVKNDTEIFALDSFGFYADDIKNNVVNYDSHYLGKYRPFTKKN